MTNGSRCARWRQMEMNHNNSGDWNITPLARDTKKSPCSLFEAFFAAELYANLFVRKLLGLLTQMGSTISNSFDKLKTFI